MKAAVIVFPGSNCDRDIALALEKSAGVKPLMLWHRDSSAPEDLDLICLPGGFSYGDYLRPGAMAAHSPIMGEVKRLAAKGVRVLGVCNGFQVMTEAGLLPGALTPNRALRYICKDIHLKVENADSAFTRGYRGGQIVRFAAAHHGGNYFADEATLKALEDDGRVAFRYCDAKGVASEAATANGSRNSIAGVLNATGTALGMMPHPERLIDAHLGGTDGKLMFDALVKGLL